MLGLNGEHNTFNDFVYHMRRENSGFVQVLLRMLVTVTKVVYQGVIGTRMGKLSLPSWYFFAQNSFPVECPHFGIAAVMDARQKGSMKGIRQERIPNWVLRTGTYIYIPSGEE